MRAVGGPLSDTITYEYGPKGRRLAKVSLLEGRTEYLYEGDEPIADYMITGAGEDRLLRRFVNGAAIDERLIILTYDETLQTATPPEVLYVHSNHQGSVMALSNGSGTRKEHFTYGPYGRIGNHEEGGAAFGFTGRRHDAGRAAERSVAEDTSASITAARAITARPSAASSRPTPSAMRTR